MDPSPCDTELVEQVRAGNRQAMGVLYIKHYGYVKKCCLTIVHDEHIAEELTDEAFLHAISKIDDFKTDGEEFAFRRWIWIIGKNLAIDHRRREKARQMLFGGSSNIDEHPASATPDPSASLVRAENRQIVRNALSRLPELTRKCIIDRDTGNKSRADICAAYGLSLNQLDNHLKKGRTFLRKELERLRNGEDF